MGHLILKKFLLRETFLSSFFVVVFVNKTLFSHDFETFIKLSRMFYTQRHARKHDIFISGKQSEEQKSGNMNSLWQAKIKVEADKISNTNEQRNSDGLENKRNF